MSVGRNIILGTLLLGGTAAAGTYFWLANTSSSSDLLQAVPHDTVMVMAMQGIPDLLQDYHLINADYEPGFISKDVWEKMQAEMKEEGIEFDISSLLLDAKLNPAGVSAITFSADISTDVRRISTDMEQISTDVKQISTDTQRVPHTYQY